MIAESKGHGRAPQILLAGVVAAVVGGVAAVSSVSPVFIAIAVVATVGAFLALDAGLASRSIGSVDLVPGVGTPSAPPTVPEPLEPPTPDAVPVVTAPEPPAVAPDDVRGARLDPGLFDPGSVEVRVSAKSAGRAFSIRVAKHGSALAECEDAVTIDPRRRVLAVADGASSSFGAHLWAGALTKQFVQQPPKPLSVSGFATWLDAAREASIRPRAAAVPDDDAVTQDPNGWWSEKGARAGAFSTVIGAVVTTDGDGRAVTVMCVGDSCAFVLTGPDGERSMRRSLPYEDASQFGSHPALLGSTWNRPHDEPSWTTVPAASGDLVILASDAVGEWLLADLRRFEIFDREEPDAVAQLFVAERTEGRIVNDDLTVAVLELTE